MDEEASQESISHNNVQDTCTSSDSEEQEMSVPKDDDPLVKSIPEPEKCYTVASAVELETEKNEGDSIVAAVADTNCAAEDEPDSHEVETEGKTNCFHLQMDLDKCLFQNIFSIFTQESSIPKNLLLFIFKLQEGILTMTVLMAMIWHPEHIDNG